MVDSDPVICKIYQELYPNDTVIVGDVNDHFRKHSDEYGFAWFSPPCQPNTRLVIANWGRYGNIPPIPNFDQVYGIQPWLKKCFKGSWVIENVIPWYEPPYKPMVNLGRHLFWSNFIIPHKKFKENRIAIDKILLPELAKFQKVDLEWLKSFKFPHWTKNHDVYRTILRNMVNKKIGKYILNCAVKPKQKTLD